MSKFNIDLKFKGTHLVYDTDCEYDYLDFINIRLPEILKRYFNE